MKIAHLLASHAEYGGLEKHVIELASAQIDEGHKVSVLVSEEIKAHLPPEIDTRVVRWTRSRRDPRLVWELVRTIRQLSPDVVHGHAHKVASLAPALRRKLNVPMVGTAHNMKRRVDGFAAYQAVTAPSRQVADTLGGLPVSVIWNAVPPFDPAWMQSAKNLQPPFASGKRTVLCAVGRLVPAKGFDLLLDALATLPDVGLWLVGEGPKRDELVQKIGDHALGERVWLPGAVSQEEAIGLMAMADLFVISSRNEGGPYTMAEALRADCSVISTRVGFVPEFLAGNQLFAEVSAPAIAKGVQEFLADPVRYREEMTPVIARANKELDLSGMAQKVMQVYESVLK